MKFVPVVPRIRIDRRQLDFLVQVHQQSAAVSASGKEEVLRRFIPFVGPHPILQLLQTTAIAVAAPIDNDQFGLRGGVLVG